MQVKKYCCKTEAIKILGLTHKKFQTLGLKPEQYMRNAWHPGWVHCFDQYYIESLVDDPVVVWLRTKGRAPQNVAENHKSATGEKTGEPDTAWIDELDWKERNDIEAQLADLSPAVDEGADWMDNLEWPERNQIEIQLADPLLDTRMNPIWKDAIAGIWRGRFRALDDRRSKKRYVNVE